MDLVELGPDQPAGRFSTGGEQIRRFRRGAGAAGSHVPEDWVGSATTVFGEASLGLTVLPDGTLLREALAADPVAWFGSRHAARWGADPALLVKLLDAGQRLPVHAHPDRAFARRHLGLPHGKTEAWVALCGADVHLGFRRAVRREELRGWTAHQDVEALLDAMHVVRLEPGDAVLVPAGLPHAIGAGAFVVELQEPTDLSVLVEWEGFDLDGARDGHLGLGFDTALAAVDLRAWPSQDVAALRGSGAGRTGDLIPDALEFFRAERWHGPVTLDAGFSVLVVTAGAGELRPPAGAAGVAAGQTWLLPHATGDVELVGDVEVVRCRPPRC